jgi:hypothetical protein
MWCGGCYLSPGLIRIVNGRWAGGYCDACFLRVQQMAMQSQQVRTSSRWPRFGVHP